MMFGIGLHDQNLYINIYIYQVLSMSLVSLIFLGWVTLRYVVFGESNGLLGCSTIQPLLAQAVRSRWMYRACTYMLQYADLNILLPTPVPFVQALFSPFSQKRISALNTLKFADFSAMGCTHSGFAQTEKLGQVAAPGNRVLGAVLKCSFGYHHVTPFHTDYIPKHLFFCMSLHVFGFAMRLSVHIFYHVICCTYMFWYVLIYGHPPQILDDSAIGRWPLRPQKDSSVLGHWLDRRYTIPLRHQRKPNCPICFLMMIVIDNVDWLRKTIEKNASSILGFVDRGLIPPYFIGFDRRNWFLNFPDDHLCPGTQKPWACPPLRYGNGQSPTMDTLGRPTVRCTMLGWKLVRHSRMCFSPMIFGHMMFIGFFMTFHCKPSSYWATPSS